MEANELRVRGEGGWKSGAARGWMKERLSTKNVMSSPGSAIPLSPGFHPDMSDGIIRIRKTERVRYVSRTSWMLRRTEWESKMVSRAFD